MKNEVSQDQPIELNENNGGKNISKVEFITVNPVETPFNNSGPPPPIAIEPQNISKIKTFIFILFKILIIVLAIFIVIFLISVFYFFSLSFSKNKIRTSIGVYIGVLNSGYYIIKYSNNSLNNYSLYNSDILLDEFSLKGLELGIKAKEHLKSNLKKEKRIYLSNCKKYLISNKSLDDIMIDSEVPQNKILNLDIVVKEYFNLLLILVILLQFLIHGIL